jgi:hypothetical protein
MRLGVVRPSWNVEGNGVAQSVQGHCFYSTNTGNCYCVTPSENKIRQRWAGQQNARRGGDQIGLLLDLDEGTMQVYKNESDSRPDGEGESSDVAPAGWHRLGEMVTGLRGEYCWAISLLPRPGDSVRIEAAPLPPDTGGGADDD